ncbi:MAG: YcxB family protein, partial [Blautia massiliensis (ex Durand et al. 2017)]
PMPLWGQALTTLAGCLLFVGQDFPAIVRSVKAVDARGGVLPTTVCVFGSGQMELQEGGIHKKLNYRKVDRLVQDKKYLYLFLGPDSVIMVDRGKIENGSDEDVMQLVEKRTGKKWEEAFSLLTVNLHDLLRLWDRRKAAKQKEK